MLTLLILSLAGAVIAAVVGTIWYMPSTPMGKIHMKYLGFDTLSPEDQKAKMKAAAPMMPKMYAAQTVLSFLTAFATVFIVTMSMKNGMTFSMALGFLAMNWLCFIVPIIGSAILWSNCDRSIAWQKFFSDIFANLVIIGLVAYLASLFA